MTEPENCFELNLEINPYNINAAGHINNAVHKLAGSFKDKFVSKNFTSR